MIEYFGVNVLTIKLALYLCFINDNYGKNL